MATTAADVLIERLQDWGVEVVFGLPGDGINGIMEALRTRRDRIRFANGGPMPEKATLQRAERDKREGKGLSPPLLLPS